MGSGHAVYRTRDPRSALLREVAEGLGLQLSDADLAEITAAADQVDLTGDRYPAYMQRWINR